MTFTGVDDLSATFMSRVAYLRCLPGQPDQRKTTLIYDVIKCFVQHQTKEVRQLQKPLYPISSEFICLTKACC